MKFLAIVVGVILAALALKLVLGVVFTLIHLAVLLLVAAVGVAIIYGLYKLILADDTDDSDRVV